MTPVIPCSASNILFIPGTAFRTRKNRCFAKYKFPGNPTKQLLSSERFFVTPPRTVAVFSQIKNGCISRLQGLSAAGTDVAVEEQDSSLTEEAPARAPEGVETNGEPSANSDVGAPQRARQRQGRKSEMPPVKDEDLVPGATFTGKVRSIQPFGAFVDFGAFTDGLVHVSRLSNNFVKDVNDVVSISQEVKVKIVEVSKETGRISLSMNDDDNSKPQQKKDPGTSGDKTRPPRKNASMPAQREEKRTTKFVMGQDLAGTVKNLTRSGAFISLPEGEEGFLPRSEESDDGHIKVTSSLEVGQEVNVRVLRISRGQVTLTMKKEEDYDEYDSQMVDGEDDTTSNAFVIAFRGNKDIAAFLDKREKAEEPSGNPATAEATEEIEEMAESADIPVAELAAAAVSAASSADVVDTVNEASLVSPKVVAKIQVQNGGTEVEAPVESPTDEAKVEPSITEGNGSVTGSSEGSVESSVDGSVTKGAVSPALVKQLRDETGAGMMDCKRALTETGGDIAKAQEYLRKKGLASADKKASRATAEGRIGAYIHDSRIGVLIEVNCETDFVSRGDIFRELVDDLAMQVAACPQVQYLSTEDVPKEIMDKETAIEMQKEDLLSKPEQIRSKIVEGRVKKRLADLALLEQPYIKNDKMTVGDWLKQTIATVGENMKVRRFVKYVLGEGLEKKSQDFAAEVAAQTAAKPAPAPEKEQPAAAEVEKPVEKVPVVAVSAALVKQLREETGAAMMDCKKALAETGCDLEKAQEYLRKKGLSSADKKSSRLAAEGRIGSYIHDARIGVLIEVNCETDFVGRSENFKALVDDLAMQVAACPEVQYVSIEDIPESIVNKEKEIEMQREDIQSKPENIREKIVQGRISKRLGEIALLEQPFIKDDSILVKDLVKQTVASLGENIKVRRFTRFTLGEQTEDPRTETEE